MQGTGNQIAQLFIQQVVLVNSGIYYNQTLSLDGLLMGEISRKIPQVLQCTNRTAVVKCRKSPRSGLAFL